MKERIITLAVLAAVSFGIAPAFAQVSTNDASIVNSDNLIADCMIQPKKCYKRVYKKCKKAKKAAPIVQKVVRIETKTIEKPAVVTPAPEPVPQAVCAPAQIVQPAVVQEQPVIIQRFEKRHRSLIHLGLFPFNLFGPVIVYD